MDERKEYALTILGSEWTMRIATIEEEPILANADGITDWSTKTMLIKAKQGESEFPLADFQSYQKEVRRHEIVHAYLFESGLGNDFCHPEYGHDETTIGWMAIQIPKMMETFRRADAL